MSAVPPPLSAPRVASVLPEMSPALLNLTPNSPPLKSFPLPPALSALKRLPNWASPVLDSKHVPACPPPGWDPPHSPDE